MRALFTTQPGFGHLNPLLPYAVALRDAGHEVRFASARDFVEAVERAGFPCHPIGENFTWEKATEYFPESAAAARAGRGMEYVIFEVVWGRWHPKATRDLLSLFGHWRPDVVVREFAEQGATFAGELAGIPVACAAWGALPTDRASWEPVWDWERMLDCYTALRGELGLPADDEPGGAWRRQLTFSALPPSWIGEAARGLRLQHVRVPPTEGPPSEPPPWLDELGRDRPLVYATLGTVFNKLRRLRASIVEALAGLDADVLLTVGRDVDPAEVGAVPLNVRVERFVPQSLVLSRASLVVSHAGLGAMLGALYNGVPMVVVGIDGDQPVNACRAGELGAAVPFGLRDATPEALRAAARYALGDPGMRAAARGLREECDAMAPVGHAVAALEELASRGVRTPSLAGRPHRSRPTRQPGL